MTFAELWLTYQLASRAHLKNSSTTQLIELEFQNHKLTDLEDVLEHVFRQGFVEAKFRPSTWWEKKDGQKVKASHSVEALLEQGIGRCPDSALRLVVQDVPTALWFTYVYRHKPCAPSVAQRIKLTPSETGGRMDLFANVTNYIFKEGFLAAKLRPVVHWEDAAGKKVEEHVRIEEVLSYGEGSCEDKALRLIVDEHPVAHHVHHDHGCQFPVRHGHYHGSPCGHANHEHAHHEHEHVHHEHEPVHRGHGHCSTCSH